LSGGRLGSFRTVGSRSGSLEHGLTATPGNTEMQSFVKFSDDANFTKISLKASIEISCNLCVYQETEQQVCKTVQKVSRLHKITALN